MTTVAEGAQNRTSALLELELQTVVGCPVGSACSKGEMHTPNHRAITSAPSNRSLLVAEFFKFIASSFWTLESRKSLGDLKASMLSLVAGGREESDRFFS